MAYKVVITEDAERDFDGFLYYLVYEKGILKQLHISLTASKRPRSDCPK